MLYTNYSYFTQTTHTLHKLLIFTQTTHTLHKLLILYTNYSYFTQTTHTLHKLLILYTNYSYFTQTTHTLHKLLILCIQTQWHVLILALHPYKLTQIHTRWNTLECNINLAHQYTYTLQYLTIPYNTLQ